MLLGAGLLMLSGCGPQVQRESESTATEKSDSEAVIETIMSRRSIRKYKPEAVNRDTMKVILDCGINAPNGQNKQSWAVLQEYVPQCAYGGIHRKRHFVRLLTNRLRPAG